MRFASVCSGIEAPSVAWKRLGWEAVFFSEIEAFPCAVLKHHYPEVPNLGDMTRFSEWPDYAIDVLIGGTPCQSFSVAGLRKGLADPRGNLALTFLAIVDRYRPRWVVWENVPGVHSSWSDEATCAASEEGEAYRAIEEARRAVESAGLDLGTDFSIGDFEEADQSSDFDCFIAGLDELGYGAATCILDAQYRGLAQRRERVFVVGHIGGAWERAGAVLFERASLRGNLAPSREAGKDVDGTFSARTKGGGELGTDFEGGIVRALDSECGGNKLTHQSITNGHIVPPLMARLSKGQGNNGGGDEYIVPAISPALNAGSGIKAPDTKTYIAHSTPIIPALVSNGDAHSGYRDEHGLVAAVQEAQTGVREYDTAGSLRANGPGHDPVGTRVRTINGVRRLTPRECERLQGFPDDYTLIGYRGKPAADGPRYKALGNSMAVTVIGLIGERIERVEELAPWRAAA